MIKKPILILGLSACFALSLFYIIMSWYLTTFDPFTVWSDNELNNPNTKKIFIIGSSQVASLNTEYMEKNLNSKNSEYVVYNLAQGADLPSLRLGDIEKLISLKPTLIIYGVGLRDFETKKHLNLSPLGSTQIEADAILPVPNLIDTKTQLELNENGFINKIFKSPQVISLRLFNYVVRGEFEYYYPDINKKTPLIPVTDFAPNIPNSEIKEKFQQEKTTFNGISKTNNKEFLAIKMILEKFHNDNIDVILFTVPSNRAYLDIVSLNDMTILENSLTEIASQYDVSVYFLHEKYADLEIWGDAYHVSYNNDTLIYSDDILSMINEIRS